MVPYCREENIALTPYSALAGGRLSKLPGEKSKRLEEDSYARQKYGSTQALDQIIIERAALLAEQKGVTLTEIALAWLLQKTAAPVVGATKIHHIEGAAKAVDVQLTEEEITFWRKCMCRTSWLALWRKITADVWDGPGGVVQREQRRQLDKSSAIKHYRYLVKMSVFPRRHTCFQLKFAGKAC